ncbi:hypothetical protein BO71DRAFT_142447 [Aspergillus ellipticus CBS 707.79]|uniref:Uncharacterized protein n=1 Tax=Aspergillus ellipticus CBS 707.79 TaxID=1448320 RepID=A0A319DT15_9EURO|nr:hypothetical protein BO71DRAFT_142447 [Aspergillus ellipticus CBS 707.79]
MEDDAMEHGAWAVTSPSQPRPALGQRAIPVACPLPSVEVSRPDERTMGVCRTLAGRSSSTTVTSQGCGACLVLPVLCPLPTAHCPVPCRYGVECTTRTTPAPHRPLPDAPSGLLIAQPADVSAPASIGSHHRPVSSWREPRTTTTTDHDYFAPAVTGTPPPHHTYPTSSPPPSLSASPPIG